MEYKITGCKPEKYFIFLKISAQSREDREMRRVLATIL